MKDDKIGDRDYLRISTWAIYFAHWPVNRIGGEQHGVVSTVLQALRFAQLNLPCASSAWGMWCTCAYLVLSQMLHSRIPRNWSLISAWGFLPDRPVLSAIHEWHQTYKLWGVFCLFWSSGFIWQHDPLLSFIAKQINSNIFPFRWIIDYLTEELMNMTVVHYMFSC